MDYFLARYYSSAQGRFTSPDEFSGGPDDLFDFADNASANPTFYADFSNPQSLNKYQYAYNNPLRYVDPNGHEAGDDGPSALDVVVAYEKAQIKGAVGVVTGTISSAWKWVTQPVRALEDAKESLGNIKDAIKTDIEMLKHPIEAGKALVGIAKENPIAVAETAGTISGQAAVAIAGGRLGAVEIEARASILPRVESVAKLGGNQPAAGAVINATRSGAERAGQIWTGRGSRPILGRQGTAVPGAFNPATGRAFRPPTVKGYGGTVANFQTRSPKANVHVNIKWSFF